MAKIKGMLIMWAIYGEKDEGMETCFSVESVRQHFVAKG